MKTSKNKNQDQSLNGIIKKMNSSSQGFFSLQEMNGLTAEMSKQEAVINKRVKEQSSKISPKRRLPNQIFRDSNSVEKS